MPVNDIDVPQRVTADQLVPDIPGVIFQFQRDHDGQLHFSYLNGCSTTLKNIDRSLLAQNAGELMEELIGEDHPKIMSAIERSARSLLPLTTRFRFSSRKGHSRWVAVSAKPTAISGGVQWNGIMIDISDQVGEEQRLRKLCDTDPLTELPNRRKLMLHLTNAVSLSSRHATPLSIMMIDIDHFKRLNDCCGHLYGDSVLTQLAIQAQSLLRCEDMIARLGGEEFMVVLPLTPLQQCHTLADRIRHTVSVHDFGMGTGQVTLSIGVAEYRCGEPMSILIDRADQALYKAKDAGRNCVCLLR